MSKNSKKIPLPEKKIKGQSNLITNYYVCKPDKEAQPDSIFLTEKKLSNKEKSEWKEKKNISQEQKINQETKDLPKEKPKKTWSESEKFSENPRTLIETSKKPQNLWKPQKIIIKPETLPSPDLQNKISWTQLQPNPTSIQDLVPSVDSKYLALFEHIFTHFQKTAGFLLTPSESQILLNFNTLNQQSKNLYVLLFKRKTQWIHTNSIFYSEIPNTIQALQGLIHSNFAVSTTSAFLLSNIQLTYDFLYTLTIPLLELLEEHLRKTLAEHFDEDYVDIQVEKPWCRALYHYTRHSVYKLEIQKIAEKIAENHSRKAEKVQAIMEILDFLAKNLKTADSEEFCSIVIPLSFPGFIKLDDNSWVLFSRLHHMYSFYSSENFLSDYGADINKNLKINDFKTTASDYPLFTSYSESLNTESVYFFFCF